MCTLILDPIDHPWRAATWQDGALRETPAPTRHRELRPVRHPTAKGVLSQPGLAPLLLAALVVEALHGSASTHLRSTSSSATMRGGLLALALGQSYPYPYHLLLPLPLPLSLPLPLPLAHTLTLTRRPAARRSPAPCCPHGTARDAARPGAR